MGFFPGMIKRAVIKSSPLPGSSFSAGEMIFEASSTRLAMVLLIGLLSPSPSAAQRCDGVEIAIATNERRCLHPGSGERFKDCADCPEMVVVPAGTFVMGSPPTEPEREGEREDQVLVTIARPLAIGAF